MHDDIRYLVNAHSCHLILLIRSFQTHTYMYLMSRITQKESLLMGNKNIGRAIDLWIKVSRSADCGRSFDNSVYKTDSTYIVGT